MKNISVVFISVFLTVICFGQKKILPGDKSINTALIKQGSFFMNYVVKQKNKSVEIGVYNFEISVSDKKLFMNTVLNFNALLNMQPWKSEVVADAVSLKPISVNADRDKGTVNLKFSNTITGEYKEKQSGRTQSIKESIPEGCFETSELLYVMMALPLETGYKATIPVYDYYAENSKRLFNTVIKEVKSDVYISQLTGEHKIWRVNAYEEGTGNDYTYYIDKDTRRIWAVDVLTSKKEVLVLTDKETDFNPFESKFDQQRALQMVNGGSATILGVAFARDNENEGMLKGMAVLNINKKQFAQKGTVIMLIPYTSYYKEWIAVNKKREKEKYKAAIPLSKEAFDCIKYTTVYDDNGQFEFANLSPGDYLLVTSFGYVHNYKRTEETGRAEVYVNGAYQGDRVYTSVFGYSTNSTANVQKVITIKKDNEKVVVKLKKTL
ncbi:MAG: carboxypeptidase-like regulatory domain-containing protein [Niabella sp.]